MKRNVIIAFTCLTALVSCSSDVDLYDAELVESEKEMANLEKVFGVKFAPNHDWCTTGSADVTVEVTPEVKTVQVLAYVREIGEESPDYVTTDVMKKLTETDVNNQSSVRLHYNAPKENLGLYVAFITDESYYVQELKGNTISFEHPAAARKTITRAQTPSYTLPKGDFKISNIINSYANTRGWIAGEKLYQLSDDDYDKLKMTDLKLPDAFMNTFIQIIFSQFPNGRSQKNLPKVKSKGYYNDKVYPITTGEEPIVVTPLYKCDKPELYNAEVYNSDLYYYYFKEDDPEYKKNPVGFIEKLPKYMAIPFNKCFGETEDGLVANHGSYALLWYGDGTPAKGTVGSFTFEEGYKIGFMIRAKCPGAARKRGEVYADGRLNNYINFYDDCNFKSSDLGKDGPRAAWLSINGRLVLCWESGTDADFNDVILDVTGGIKGIEVTPDPDPQVYTYCFEDHNLGDYDMNDVVIKAYKVNEQTVRFSIIACGAYDELYVRGIECGDILNSKEIHSYWGKKQHSFINTENNNVFLPPITAEKTYPNGFDAIKDAPYIWNETEKDEIHIVTTGMNPRAIMIPNDFYYPLEKTCISDAYHEFNTWGVSTDFSKLDWYTKPTNSLVRRRK